MVSDLGRFQAPSDQLNFNRFLRETLKYTVWGLLIGAGLIAGVFVYWLLSVEERDAPEPALTRLIIRKPRATKTFALKRQRLRPRALTKQVTALKPRLSVAAAPRLKGASVFGNVQTFEYALQTDVPINLKTSSIELSAAKITGTKDPEKRIAMREELIDLNALDTGKYKGLIIQDPTDRRKVKGFVYLGTAWANDLKPTFDSAAKAIPNLVDALHSYGLPSFSPHKSFERYYRAIRGQSGNEFYRFDLRMGNARSTAYIENQKVFKGERYSGLIAFDPLNEEVEQVRLVLENFVLKFDASGQPLETVDIALEFDQKIATEKVATNR